MSVTDKTIVSTAGVAPMRRSRGRTKRAGLGAVLALGGLALLSACAGTAPAGDDAAAPPTPEKEAPATPVGDSAASSGDAGHASAVIAGREFTFTLASCTVYEEREVELGGPGGEDGSDTPSYLDGGLMAMGSDARGEFRIDIGATGPFASSEEFLALGAPVGGDFTVEKDGDGYLATGNSWDDNGTDLGVGTLRFTCS